MRSKRICKVAWVVLSSSFFLCHAQMGKPRPVTLRCIVTIDGDAERARNVTVELSGEMDSGSARAITNQDGEVIFQTMSGAYRVRVTGPGIRPYESEVEMAPIESTHLERIRVRSNATSSPIPGAPIAAVRLHIPDPARKQFEKGGQALHKEHWDESKTLFSKCHPRIRRL